MSTHSTVLIEETSAAWLRNAVGGVTGAFGAADPVHLAPVTRNSHFLIRRSSHIDPRKDVPHCFPKHDLMSQVVPGPR